MPAGAQLHILFGQIWLHPRASVPASELLPLRRCGEHLGFHVNSFCTTRAWLCVSPCCKCTWRRTNNLPAGRISGIVDVPNACATLAIPLAIFDQVPRLPSDRLPRQSPYAVTCADALEPANHRWHHEIVSHTSSRAAGHPAKAQWHRAADRAAGGRRWQHCQAAAVRLRGQHAHLQERLPALIRIVSAKPCIRNQFH